MWKKKFEQQIELCKETMEDYKKKHDELVKVYYILIKLMIMWREKREDVVLVSSVMNGLDKMMDQMELDLGGDVLESINSMKCVQKRLMNDVKQINETVDKVFFTTNNPIYDKLTEPLKKEWEQAEHEDLNKREEVLKKVARELGFAIQQQDEQILQEVYDNGMDNHVIALAEGYSGNNLSNVMNTNNFDTLLGLRNVLKKIDVTPFFKTNQLPLLLQQGHQVHIETDSQSFKEDAFKMSRTIVKRLFENRAFDFLCNKEINNTIDSIKNYDGRYELKNFEKTTQHQLYECIVTLWKHPAFGLIQPTETVTYAQFCHKFQALYTQYPSYIDKSASTSSATTASTSTASSASSPMNVSILVNMLTIPIQLLTVENYVKYPEEIGELLRYYFNETTELSIEQLIHMSHPPQIESILKYNFDCVSLTTDAIVSYMHKIGIPPPSPSPSSTTSTTTSSSQPPTSSSLSASSHPTTINILDVVHGLPSKTILHLLQYCFLLHYVNVALRKQQDWIDNQYPAKFEENLKATYPDVIPLNKKKPIYVNKQSQLLYKEICDKLVSNEFVLEVPIDPSSSSSLPHNPSSVYINTSQHVLYDEYETALKKLSQLELRRLESTQQIEIYDENRAYTKILEDYIYFKDNTKPKKSIWTECDITYNILSELVFYIKNPHILGSITNEIMKLCSMKITIADFNYLCVKSFPDISNVEIDAELFHIENHATANNHPIRMGMEPVLKYMKDNPAHSLKEYRISLFVDTKTYNKNIMSVGTTQLWHGMIKLGALKRIQSEEYPQEIDLSVFYQTISNSESNRLYKKCVTNTKTLIETIQKKQDKPAISISQMITDMVNSIKLYFIDMREYSEIETWYMEDQDDFHMIAKTDKSLRKRYRTNRSSHETQLPVDDSELYYDAIGEEDFVDALNGSNI